MQGRLLAALARLGPTRRVLFGLLGGVLIVATVAGVAGMGLGSSGGSSYVLPISYGLER